MSRGVYGIKQDDRLLYIGSSDELEKRWAHHRWMLKAGKHSNKHIQAAYDNGELPSIEFYVIDPCEGGDLIEREKMWIAELKPEFNMLYAPDGKGAWTHDEETRKRMGDFHRGKKHNMSPEGRAKCAENGRRSRGTRWKMNPESVRKSAESRTIKCPISKEELKSLLEEYVGFSNIAAFHPEYSKHDKAVIKRWCVEYGLPYMAVDYGHKRGMPAPSTEELAYALKEIGYKNAAKKFDTSPNVVKRWCRELGWPYKRADWEDIDPEEILGRQ